MKRMIAIAAGGAPLGVAASAEEFQWTTIVDGKTMGDFDKRPDPTYGIGAIVDVAKVVPMPKAGGKWNTYDITAKGDHFIVVLNGQKTVDMTDDRLLDAGPIAPQYGSGSLKWREIQIRSL